MILAVGATGRLLPVVEALLARGHAVRVTARDPGSPIAGDLSARGVDVVRADLDDPDSLTAAAQGAEAVFAAGSPHQAGPGGEARQGINALHAAAAAGVGHFVFSSGAGAERVTGVPVLDSKHAVEQRIAEVGVPYTILAPVYFMENAFNPWNLAALAAGRFPLALPANRPLQQLAIKDLAAVAAIVLAEPDRFAGQRLTLAGDELSGEQAALALSRVTGRPFTFEEVPVAALAPPMRRLFEWLERVGHDVDIAPLQGRFVDVRWHRFEEWAATRDWPHRP